MERKPIDEAVKDFEDAWNAHKIAEMKSRLQYLEDAPSIPMKTWVMRGGLWSPTKVKQYGDYAEIERAGFPLGIINFDDSMITEGFPHYADLHIEGVEEEEETDARTEKIMEETLWMERRKHYESLKERWQTQEKNRPERISELKERVENYHPIRFRLTQKQKYGDLEKGRAPHAWEEEEEIWEKWAVVDLGTTDSDRRGGLMKYGGYGRAEPKKYLRGHLYWKTPIKEGWLPKKQKDRIGKDYGHPLKGAMDANGRLSDYGLEYY